MKNQFKANDISTCFKNRIGVTSSISQIIDQTRLVDSTSQTVDRTLIRFGSPNWDKIELN